MKTRTRLILTGVILAALLLIAASFYLDTGISQGHYLVRP